MFRILSFCVKNICTSDYFSYFKCLVKNFNTPWLGPAWKIQFYKNVVEMCSQHPAVLFPLWEGQIKTTVLKMMDYID